MLQNEKMLKFLFYFSVLFFSRILWGRVIILGWICVSLGLLVKTHLNNTLISLTEVKNVLKDARPVLFSILDVMIQMQGVGLTPVLHVNYVLLSWCVCADI